MHSRILNNEWLCSSVSSTNTSAALPLLKFWVLNFSIRFFSFWGFLVYRMQICSGFKNNFFFFFKHKLDAGRILNFYWYLPKHPKTPEIDQNDPKFFPKWNRVGYCFGLFTDMVFSGRNGMKLITLNQT